MSLNSAISPVNGTPSTFTDYLPNDRDTHRPPKLTWNAHQDRPHSGHKTRLDIYERIETVQYMSLGHNRTNLESMDLNWKEARKSPNIQRPSNTFYIIHS